MPTDFRKSPTQILIDLINESNGTSLLSSDITFGVPAAIENASRNTAIRITATPNSRYVGSRDLTYDRVLVSQVTDDYSDATFDIAGIPSIHALLPSLNDTFQVNFTVADLEDTVLPTADPDDTVFGSFVLKAKPGSLVYRGEGSVDYVIGFPSNYAAFHHFLHATLPLEVFA